MPDLKCYCRAVVKLEDYLPSSNFRTRLSGRRKFSLITLGNFKSKPQQQQQQESHETKGLTRKTLYNSLPFRLCKITMTAK